MSTFEKIRDIFYSGNPAFSGMKESINEIAFLVDEGYFTFSTLNIATKKEYLDFFNDPSLEKVRIHDAAGGGAAHVALKILSGKYLETARKLKISYEQPLCGYFPDVVSKDGSTVVECGLTQNAEKVLIYFVQGDIKEFIQVPYPVDEDDSIMGYSFTARDDLKDFLIFLQTEKNSQIKNLLNNGRK